MDASAGCFICRKHAGLEEQPPGGYLVEKRGLAFLALDLHCTEAEAATAAQWLRRVLEAR